MKKTAATLAILALGTMLAAGTATESMAHGGGGGHGGGFGGGGFSGDSGHGDGGRGLGGGDHGHGRGGSHGAHAASHSPHSSERERRAPTTDDGVLSPMNDPHQQYFFRSLFR